MKAAGYINAYCIVLITCIYLNTNEAERNLMTEYVLIYNKDITEQAADTQSMFQFHKISNILIKIIFIYGYMALVLPFNTKRIVMVGK